MRELTTFIAILLILSTPISLLAYGDKETHPRLTEKAIDSSKMGEVFVKQLGFINAIGNTYLHASIYNGVKVDDNTTWSVIDLMRYGAEMEDNPDCRASNHFLNPLKEWVLT